MRWEREAQCGRELQGEVRPERPDPCAPSSISLPEWWTGPVGAGGEGAASPSERERARGGAGQPPGPSSVRPCARVQARPCEPSWMPLLWAASLMAASRAGPTLWDLLASRQVRKFFGFVFTALCVHLKKIYLLRLEPPSSLDSRSSSRLVFPPGCLCSPSWVPLTLPSLGDFTQKFRYHLLNGDSPSTSPARPFLSSDLLPDRLQPHPSPAFLVPGPVPPVVVPV